MVAKRVGSAHEVTTTAARAVKSGHLHECPDGRAGVYMGSQDVASGESLTLHVCEKLELVAGAFAATTAGALANFDYDNQQLVASDGDANVGRYVFAKALNATKATVILNDSGPSSSHQQA